MKLFSFLSHAHRHGQPEASSSEFGTDANALKRFIPHVESLLAYAASSGIAVEQDATAAIIHASTLSSAGTGISEADQVAFWAAVGKVTKATSPVTVESLAATDLATGRAGFWRSAATRWIGWFSVVVVVATLVLQIWAAVLGSRIDRYKDAVKDYAIATQCQSLAAKAVGAGANPVVVPDDCKNARPLPQVQMTKDAAVRLLEKSWLVQYAVPADVSDEKAVDHDSLVAETAKNVSDVLYKFLLPFFYGLLGSIIYVLRVVSQQIQERSYTWSARFSGVARLLLGPILGIASLVLISPSTDKGLQNLPPLAIALVAGYSVDLLLSFMDRISHAFKPDTVVKPSS